MTHCHLYMTDFGAVRVSEREASLLDLAGRVQGAWPRRMCGDRLNRLMDKADLLRVDIERVAKFKAGIQ